ncbi:TonB family protein [Mangrovimicrobium sediminis]|uniref:TonB family protein n=1 Tax=Mangrovimicrobium sediminis TaxID=2562682 RepID=UPI001436CA75|nr:TonB family protein [Haliea sp. SAOS-164]
MAVAAAVTPDAQDTAPPSDLVSESFGNRALLSFCQGHLYGENGYPLDIEKAFRWCRESAERGSAAAQMMLAEIYLMDDWVEHNPAEAVRWYTRAEEQGNAHAAFVLAVIYGTGDVVPQDRDKAYVYLMRAASAGHSDAIELLRSVNPDYKPPPTEAEIAVILEKNSALKFAPVYPPQALREGTEGYTVVEYTIDVTGRTADLRIIASEPAGVFDEASLNAARKFRYRPTLEDGVPVERRGVTNKFTFELEDDPGQSPGKSE